jgi:hypothetical protein
MVKIILTFFPLSNHLHHPFSRIDSPSDAQDSSNSFQEWSGSELLQWTNNLLCHRILLFGWILCSRKPYEFQVMPPSPPLPIDRLSCHRSLAKLKIHLSQDLLREILQILICHPILADHVQRMIGSQLGPLRLKLSSHERRPLHMSFLRYRKGF